MKRRDDEDYLAESATGDTSYKGHARPSRIGDRKRHRKDAFLGTIVSGLAAASLAEDFEESLDQQSHDGWGD